MYNVLCDSIILNFATFVDFTIHNTIWGAVWKTWGRDKNRWSKFNKSSLAN